MRNFLEAVARTIEEWEGLGSALDGAGLASSETLRQLIVCDSQAGIELMISILRNSPERVVIHTAGSCRDVAEAFNREPALFKEKVRAIYMNIGNGLNNPQNEYNVGLDLQGYLRMFESGLPLYWCPCFGNDGYQTVYELDQATVLAPCAQPVQNFFVYCLTKSNEEPVAFLHSGPHALPTSPRGMYCTGPLLHAAGRKIYQRASEDYGCWDVQFRSDTGEGRGQ